MFMVYSGDDVMSKSIEAKLPECPYYVAHPQAVWFNEHWRPVIEQLKAEIEQLKNDLTASSTVIDILKADLRTSDLNRQSLWADSVKMADELNYLKAKTDIEIQQLKSKLKIAVDALKKIKNISAYAGNPTKEIFGYLIKQSGIKSPMISHQALSEIGEV